MYKVIYKALKHKQLCFTSLFTVYVRASDKNCYLLITHQEMIFMLFDSRCQSFTARRGPVVHLADLMKHYCMAARPNSCSNYSPLACSIARDRRYA